MEDEIDFNETIGEPQRNCDQCGRLDNTSFCRNDHVEEDAGEHLCFDCAGENGFCFGCGQFCAGMESFDFSPIPGYCANCVDQIKSTVADDDPDPDDDAYYEEWMRMQ
jgi:hypothetical protein